MPKHQREMDDNVAIEINSGIHQAFEEFYFAYRERFYIYTNKIVNNSEIAQDIVSDTFTACWEFRQKFSRMGEIQAYMLVTCRNKAFNYLKYGSGFKNKRELAVADLETVASDQAIENEVLRELIKKDYIDAVRNAMRQLPPQMQAIIEHIYFDGLSVEEVAIKLKTSNNTVSVGKSRALIKLRELLANHPMVDLIMIYLFSS